MAPSINVKLQQINNDGQNEKEIQLNVDGNNNNNKYCNYLQIEQPILIHKHFDYNSSQNSLQQFLIQTEYGQNQNSSIYPQGINFNQEIEGYSNQFFNKISPYQASLSIQGYNDEVISHQDLMFNQ